MNGNSNRKITDLKKETRSVRLEDLNIDLNCYPRCYIKSEIVKQYAEAMKAGEVFPRIVTIPDPDTKDKFIILDGIHRFEALKLLDSEKGKEDGTVDIEVILGEDFSTADKIALAVEFNLRHGQPFDSADISRIRQITKRENGVSVWASDWQKQICQEILTSVKEVFIDRVQGILEKESTEEDEIASLYKYGVTEILEDGGGQLNGVSSFGETGGVEDSEPSTSGIETESEPVSDPEIFGDFESEIKTPKKKPVKKNDTGIRVTGQSTEKKTSRTYTDTGARRSKEKETASAVSSEKILESIESSDIEQIGDLLDVIMEKLIVASRQADTEKLLEVAWVLFYYAFSYHRKFMVEVFHSQKDFDTFVRAAVEYVNTSYLPDMVKVKITNSLKTICS